MKKEQLLISTTASDADAVARQYGLGIEIAEYCTAWNMDEKFAETDATVLISVKVYGVVSLSHLSQRKHDA